MGQSRPEGLGAQRSGHVVEPPIADVLSAHLVDLMCRVAGGDQHAFAELYDLTVRRVFGTVFQVLRSAEHAEEVTQEVYAELWQQAARYNPDRGSVVTWLIAMARHRAVDRVRSVSSEVARVAKYASAVQPEVDDVWDRAVRQEDIERVRKGLRALTDLESEALTLAYYENLTQSQIAGRLNVPLGTVKSRTRAAMKHLGKALGGGA